MEKLRTLLYGARTAREVPWLVHSAAACDFKTFLEAVCGEDSSLLADGLYLSITCTESIGAMDYARAGAIQRASPAGLGRTGSRDTVPMVRTRG